LAEALSWFAGSVIMLFFFCQYFQAESGLKRLLSAIGGYTQVFTSRLKAER
jgi:hypothetical protein